MIIWIIIHLYLILSKVITCKLVLVRYGIWDLKVCYGLEVRFFYIDISIWWVFSISVLQYFRYWCFDIGLRNYHVKLFKWWDSSVPCLLIHVFLFFIITNYNHITCVHNDIMTFYTDIHTANICTYNYWFIMFIPYTVAQ